LEEGLNRNFHHDYGVDGFCLQSVIKKLPKERCSWAMVDGMEGNQYTVGGYTNFDRTVA
jgi:hypothetical protein